MATTERSQIQNPYSTGNRAQYKMGGFEQFLHDIGFRTGYDNYQMEMDNLAQQWETQNQSLSYEENYNSPEEQAARMRAAGINPDIAGDMNPGQAAEMTEPTEGPTGYQTDVDYLQEAVETSARMAAGFFDILGTIQGVESVLSGAVDIRNKFDQGEFDAVNRLTGLVKQNPMIFEELGLGAGEGELEPSATHAEPIYKALGLSKRNRERMEKFRRSYLNSIPGKIARRQYENTLAQEDTLYKMQDVWTKTLELKQENAAKMEQFEADLLQRYPQVISEAMLAKWRKGIFETQKEGAEAGIAGAENKVAQAEKEYRIKYAEYKDEQAKIDLESAREYKDIMDNGNYWLSPEDAVKFHTLDRKKRNADRRIYGNTSEGVEDYVPKFMSSSPVKASIKK